MTTFIMFIIRDRSPSDLRLKVENRRERRGHSEEKYSDSGSDNERVSIFLPCQRLSVCKFFLCDTISQKPLIGSTSNRVYPSNLEVLVN